MDKYNLKCTRNLQMKHDLVHETQSCTWNTILYMKHDLVHETQSSTWNSILHMKHNLVHEAWSCTWNTILYMKHDAVNTILYIKHDFVHETRFFNFQLRPVNVQCHVQLLEPSPWDGLFSIIKKICKKFLAAQRHLLSYIYILCQIHVKQVVWIWKNEKYWSKMGKIIIEWYTNALLRKNVTNLSSS